FALYPMLRIWYGSSSFESRSSAEDRSSEIRTQNSWLHFAAAGFFAGVAACTELPALSMLVIFAVLLALRWPARTALFFIPAAAIPVAIFFLTNYLAIGQLRPAYSEFGGPWYEFPGSFWVKPPEDKVKPGIDWAGRYESKVTYAFNLQVGHHGWFSLTPIWIL